jgi:hypothetical protein
MTTVLRRTVARVCLCLGVATSLAAVLLLVTPALVPSGRGPLPAAAAATGVTVSGNLLLKDGEPFLPRGFNMIGLLTPAWCDRTTGIAARDHFGTAELAAAKAWGANTLRFQVSQRGLSDPTLSEADRQAYVQRIVDGVALARQNGFVVIVSMQDQYYGCGPVHPMPSAQTVDAWTRLAPALMSDPYVLFELFNEPRNDTDAAGWAQWRDGGSTPDPNLGDPAVGHQALVDTLRRLGSTNVLLADTARLGERTTGLPRLSDPTGNIGYAIHPYYFTVGPTWWDQQYGSLAAAVPVVATEWNYLADRCGGAEERLAPALLDYLQQHRIGVLGHAFDALGTTVADWAWTPTGCGTATGGSGQVLRNWFAAVATADGTPPSAPSGLTARIVSPTEVQLRWQPATDDVGVTGYRITRDGVPLTTVAGPTAGDRGLTSGAHTYVVTALDAALNESAPAQVAVVLPAAAPRGLTGTYFDTAGFTTQRLVRVDPTVDFARRTGRPARPVGPDTFSVRWTGRLLPVGAGSYTFSVLSDDAARLWIDGRLVVDDWTPHALREAQGSILLTADQAHDVRLDYVERSGAATVRLSWSGPGLAKQVVPAAQLLSR